MTDHGAFLHPRPQFVREGWTSLNGIWRFQYDDEEAGLDAGWTACLPEGRSIRVPFAPEAPMSGIGDERMHPVVWYQRTLRLCPAEGKRILVHFEGCDFRTTVFLNGTQIGAHEGGCTRFTCDLTDQARPGENTLVVRAEDSFSRSQPRGKQRWKDENFGCWYVQTTGIWKDVWMEEVPEARLTAARITPLLEERSLRIFCTFSTDQPVSLETTVSLNGKTVAFRNTKHTGKELETVLRFTEAPVPWTPEDPVLYNVDFRLFLGDRCVDEVHSYTGMRSVTKKNGRLLLNGEPVYLRMVLDQGYWAESHLTPPDREALRKDVSDTKALGFNGARKHQKVEDERWYYDCDVLGLLVWHEMPSAYDFTEEARANFSREWKEAVLQDMSHPSIIAWVPFNESWGIGDVLTDKEQQAFCAGIVRETRALDPSRPVISNDGWEHVDSDVITLHDYDPSGQALTDRYGKDLRDILSGRISHNNWKMPFADCSVYRGEPVVISEYGGVALEGSEGWGYHDKAADEDECLRRIRELTDAIRGMDAVCGFCYTQLTDVQQEVNGLKDAAHKDKFPIERVRDIFAGSPENA